MTGYQENLFLAVVLLWILAYIIARSHEKRLKLKGITIKPLLFIFRIHNIEGFFDRIVARFPRTRPLFDYSPIVVFPLMLAGILFLANNLRMFFTASKSFAAVTPVIPFVTIQSPMLLLFFFLSIPVIVIPHEFFHAIAARMNGIKLKSGGIAVIALLFAGFVEPDEGSFRGAQWKARLKMVSAGSLANTIIGILVIIFLLTQPYTHVYLPSEVANLAYAQPSGIFVMGVVRGLPVEKAGLKPGDIIVGVNGTSITSTDDYSKLKLKPGSFLILSVLRDHRDITISSKTVEEGGRTILGYYGITYRKPYFPLPALDRITYSFLLWLSMFSLMVAVFNMLPLYPFDGGLYLDSLIEAFTSNDTVRRSVIGAAYALSAILLFGNIVASILKFGFISL